MMAGGLVAGATMGSAQEAAPLPSVRVPPAAIEFEPWKLVERTEDVDEYVVEFPSPLPVGDPVNRTVQLRVLVPRGPSPLARGGKLPVVLILHYLGARDLRLERSLAGELNARGVAAAIMTLPYHLSRTPPGARSGELAIQPSPQALREVMTQSALDLRRSLAFLRTRPEFDPGEIGIAGISLGAIIASLGYALEPGVDTAAFLLGGADLARIVWGSTRLVAARERLRGAGYTEAKLRRELVSVEPLTYLAERPKTGREFVIRGSYDTVIPPASSEALSDALNDPQRLVIDTGHYGGIFVQRRLVREMASFFARSFAGEAYVAPRNLSAPTVRVGLVASTPGVFDVAAGLDVYRFDKRGRGTASLLLTPRGPQLFIGAQAAEGFRLGLSITPSRVGVGAFFSVVL